MNRTVTQPFIGSWRLVRLALRRDRIILPVWIVAISGLAGAVLASYSGTYTNEAERADAAAFGASNPMTRVFDGPASGTSLGAMALVEAFKVLAILTALMSAQAVIRHTRADEETGRAELLGSAVVGRHARLTAALVVTLGADLVLGVAVAGLLVANDLPVAGSFAAGMAAAGMGWVFAGIAAIGAQVLSTTRGANAATAAALAIAFVIRAVGDLLGHVGDSGVVLISAWPSWVSPLGWGQQVRPYYQDNWWIAGLFAGLTALLVAGAFRLTSLRDVGSGMVPPRPGSAHAGRGLRSTLGLAWRLQRGVLLVWAIGLVGLAAAFGAVGKSAEDLLTDNAQVAQMFARLSPGADVIDVYFTVLMAIVGTAAAGYTVQALLRMRAEEDTGRLEPVLATPVGRHQWLASHAIIAAGGTTAILALAGLAGGLVYGGMAGEWAASTRDALAAALVQAPAALALGALVLALFGLLPRESGPLAWAALAAALVMGQLGAMLDLPQWLLDVSPFTHVPRVPAEAFSATPVVWLLATTVALGAVGFAAFRRRDLAIGA